MSPMPHKDQESFFFSGEGDKWYNRNEKAINSQIDKFDWPVHLAERIADRDQIRSVCELGASNGWRLEKLKPVLPGECEYFGTDISRQAVEEGMKLYSGLKLSVSSLAETDLKRRFDLVSGEAGENVFGAGLSAALDELKRQEDAYIALFMGTHTTEQIVRTYEVVPEAGKTTVIVCRFSETGGLLADSDLTGRPVLLEMTPEQKVQNTVLPRPGGRESRGSVFYRVADIARCRLLDEMNVLLDERVPIYQFGEVVDIPVTSIR